LIGGNTRVEQPAEFKAPIMPVEEQWWLKYQTPEEAK
jgi:hypothetical protein